MSGPAPRPFACPQCQTDKTAIRTSTQRPSLGGRVRYRVCEACDLYFTTLQKPGEAEVVIPEKQRSVRVRSHLDLLDRQNWNCDGCEFRAHCDRIVATYEALPCEKYMFLEENPDLLAPKNLPYSHGSIQTDGTFVIALY